ncbi:hypothetical protein AB3S75_033207 [Citrus x aurantiifolia]
MGRTQIISKSTVCAAIHKEPNLRIDLTPWDLKLIQFDTIQKGLLFRKPSEDNTDTSSLNLIHHLKTSLSRTLDYFPALAGRLATIEHRDDVKAGVGLAKVKLDLAAVQRNKHGFGSRPKK